MADEHAFQALHVAADAVAAACSCGWVSAYSHAFDKYAREDHAFHVEMVRDG